ncbi:hypothetical protein OSCT_3149 [Oscillochloris trichoides DG-6]|uniref:Gingipain domain-containing protein n=1 Tax=Oscillochloris trichoides DG-6 TaxID=765420 RepID=E1IIJ8_9CHLR|nr:hypothetical protein [Oscillochloris trichoides]EFO78988.1 hypothetical protein OSCT_3149 [Oscillochloris trichoides DG-6]
MASELLYFNGVNGSRGTYGRQPITADQLSALIRGEDPKPENLDPDPEQLQELQRRATQVRTGNFGVKEGVSERDLAQTGWGVIFAAGPQSAPIREALSELLAWRKAQAGERYRECSGALGYRPNESKADFLRRQGAATSGPVDPDKFPYYLLLVGSPEEIPFRFQYQIDVQYAVGRIHFETLDEYARYARSVVASERGEVKLPRKAVFFGVRNRDDAATTRAADELVVPLSQEIRKNPRADEWAIETIIGDAAKKDRLRRLLGGEETPALLFTASHGVEFDHGDVHQVPHQGAILCQDWPGPRLWRGPIPQEFYLAGDDLDSRARLLGTVAFCFACFGAGTPRNDDFPHQKGIQSAIAPHAFISRLPQQMLGHPNGGALAVIGHVERAWTFSFSDARGGRQIETFSSAMRRMMLDGAPVGWALEFFNNRYAELASVLTEDLENAHWGGSVDPFELSTKWTEHNDSRSYVVIGDPAVRLPLADVGAAPPPAERVTIPVVTAPKPAPTPVAPATPVTPATPVAPAVPSVPGIPGLGTQPAMPTGMTDESGASFGLFGSGEKKEGEKGAVSEVVQKLTASIQEFAERIGETLKRTIEDASHLEVETYVADDLTTVNYRSGDFNGAQLRAVTRMSLDGDTQVMVPRREGQIDEELWAIHLSMVQQAQANRAEMIRTIANAAAGLLGALK